MRTAARSFAARARRGSRTPELPPPSTAAAERSGPPAARRQAACSIWTGAENPAAAAGEGRRRGWLPSSGRGAGQRRSPKARCMASLRRRVKRARTAPHRLKLSATDRASICEQARGGFSRALPLTARHAGGLSFCPCRSTPSERAMMGRGLGGGSAHQARPGLVKSANDLVLAPVQIIQESRQRIRHRRPDSRHPA